MAVNSWSQVAPIGPYKSDIDQIPVQVRRDWFLQRLSRNSLPFFRSNTRAVKNLENRTGVLVIVIQKVGLAVTFWAPKGTAVDWGDTGTTAATAADGDVTHTYAGAGTYLIKTTNALSNGQGQASVTV